MNQFLSFVDDRLLIVLWDATLKGTLLLALAGAAAAAARRASAATRHLIFSTALVGALLLPALSLLLPEWRVPWVPQWLAAQTFFVNECQSPLQSVSSELQATVLNENLPRADVPPRTEPDATIQSNQNTNSAVVQPTELKPFSAAKMSPLQIAAAVWLAGMLLTLAPLAVGTFLLARLTRRSGRYENSAWNSQATSLSTQLGLTRPVMLLVNERVRSPLTWGAWRPIILLPNAVDNWPAERRRVVLLHELAHVKRFDWLTQSLAYIACSIYWFNPLAWWAARRMRVEREAACDDAVLAAGSRPADYAEELLKLASAIMQRRLVDWAAVPMARRSTLEGRLLAILDSTRNRSALTRAVIAATMITLITVAVPIAMMRAEPHLPTIETSTAQSDLNTADNPRNVKRPTTEPSIKEAVNDDTAWGEPTNGLQAGIALLGPPRAYHIGENVPVVFRVRNVSERPITFQYSRVPVFINWNNYRQPPGPQLTGPDGKLVLPVERGVGGMGLPGRVTRTLRPGGETADIATVSIPIRDQEWKGVTVNLLAYATAPGKHSLSLSYEFDGSPASIGSTTLTTGMLGLELAATLDPPSKETPWDGPWGEAMDSIRARLRTDKSQLKAGEQPILLVDLVNHGTRTVKEIWHGLDFRLQVDGKWVGKLSPTEVHGPVTYLEPGQEWINVPLVLRDEAYWIAPNEPGGSGAQFKLAQFLPPGKHTLRVEVDGVASNETMLTIGEPAAVAMHFGPVTELVVHYPMADADKDLDLDTGKFIAGLPALGRAQRLAAGVDLYVSPLQSDLRAVTAIDMWTFPVLAIDWDRLDGAVPPAVINPIETAWPLAPSDLPTLQADARRARDLGEIKPETVLKQGTYLFATKTNFGLLQVLGATGPDEKTTNGVKVRFKLLASAGQPQMPPAPEAERPDQPTRKFVLLVAGPGALTFEGQSTTWEQLPELLGRIPDRAHTVLELAVSSDNFTMAQVGDVQGHAQPLAKQFGFEYFSFVGVHPLGSKSASPAEPPPAAELPTAEETAAWGAAVANIAVRLHPPTAPWQSDQPGRLVFDVQNVSNQTVRPIMWQQMCRLEVNGTLYQWRTPSQVPMQELAENEVRNGIELDYPGEWEDLTSNTRLRLAPGKYVVRVWVQTGRYEGNPVEAVFARSNPVTIEVAASTASRPSDGQTSITPALNQRIQQLIKGAPATIKIETLEIFELIPGSQSEYRIRADVAGRSIVGLIGGGNAGGGGGAFVPVGHVYYLKDRNRFYVQWDGMGASTLHYYGPFQGDPATVLGLPLQEKTPDNSSEPGPPAVFNLRKSPTGTSELFWGQRKLTTDELRTELAAMSPEEKRRVALVADAGVPYSEVVKYLDLLQSLGVTSVSLDTPPTKDADAWGESVSGLSIQLILAAPTVNVADLPKAVPLHLAIRNQSQSAFNLAQSQVLGELEFDGKWYKFTGMIGTRGGLFPAGREVRDLPVTLTSEWHTLVGDVELKPAPGKHTVRFTISATPTAVEGRFMGEPPSLHVVSNPVDVLVSAGPAQPAPNAGATGTDNRSVFELSSVKGLDIQWGQPNDKGVRAGIAIDPVSSKPKLGDAVRCQVFLQNIGTVDQEISTPKTLFRPQYFTLTIHDESGTEIPLQANPAWKNADVQWSNRTLTPGAVTELGIPLVGIGPGQFGPNVQTVVSVKSGQKYGIRIRLEDWVFANPKVYGKLTTADLTFSVANSDTEAAAGKSTQSPIWGESRDGIQVSARTEKPLWQLGETPILILDVRNVGDKPINYIAVPAAECRLKIDGDWYGRSASFVIRIPVQTLQPGQTMPRPLTIPLTAVWARPKDPNRWIPGVPSEWAELLDLKPGKHTVQVMFIPEGGRNNLNPTGPLSNSVEITIAEPLAANVDAAIGPVRAADVTDADLIVVGRVDSNPGWASDKTNVGAFYCDFKVVDVIRGGDYAGKTLSVAIFRKSPPNGPQPEMHRGDELILLLKKIDNDANRQWATIGYENGSLTATPEAIRAVKQLTTDFEKRAK